LNPEDLEKLLASSGGPNPSGIPGAENAPSLEQLLGERPVGQRSGATIDLIGEDRVEEPLTTLPRPQTWEEKMPSGGMPPFLGGDGTSVLGGADKVAQAYNSAAAFGQGGGIKSIGSALKGILGKIDPTTAILGGLSLFGGGDDGQQQRQGFGGSVAPEQVLGDSIAAIKRLGSSIQNREPGHLNAVVNGKPAPVNIEGLPFQIGGGLATDPALQDPSLLQLQDAMKAFETGGSTAQQKPNPGAKLRFP
jgi:hypothetical protein